MVSPSELPLIRCGSSSVMANRMPAYGDSFKIQLDQHYLTLTDVRYCWNTTALQCLDTRSESPRVLGNVVRHAQDQFRGRLSPKY